MADNSLGSLVNLSQLEQLRPGLGTAGTVELLVEKWRSGRSGVAGDSLVRTLCLYCRESVNRVRMREAGGCSVSAVQSAVCSTGHHQHCSHSSHGTPGHSGSFNPKMEWIDMDRACLKSSLYTTLSVLWVAGWCAALEGTS